MNQMASPQPSAYSGSVVSTEVEYTQFHFLLLTLRSLFSFLLPTCFDDSSFTHSLNIKAVSAALLPLFL